MPRIPKMTKKVQQIMTMLPIGRSEDIKVWTTSFRPGALLMTLDKKITRTNVIKMSPEKHFI